MLTSAKLRELWIYKVYFVKLNMCLHLRTKSQLSSVILTRFRQGVVLPPFPSSKQTPKKAFEIIVNINCNIDGSSHPDLFLEKYVFKEKAKFFKNLQKSSLFSESASCNWKISPWQTWGLLSSIDIKSIQRTYMEVTHRFSLNLHITVLETIPAVFCYHLLSNSKPTHPSKWIHVQR